ncbi:phage tail sheath family protein [Pyxidicoccus sp. 3LG]
MSIAPTYPGVYVEEIPSGVRTITGVGTSVTAFVGFTTQGPINKPIQVHNFGDFEREFGGLGRESEVSYAVRQFFLNGGSDAWVIRTAAGASKASVSLRNPSGASSHGAVLTVTAVSEGTWGNLLRLDVDYDTNNPDSSFNLFVTEYKSNGTQLVANRTESHRNLSMDSSSAQYAVSTVNTNSALIRLTRDTRIDSTLLGGLPSGWSESGDLTGINFADFDANHSSIAISINGDPATVIPIFDPSSPPADLGDIADFIVARVKTLKPGNAAYSGFSGQQVTGANRLRFTAGGATGANQERSSVRISSAPQQDAARLLKLGLANGGREADAVAALRPAPDGNISKDLTTVTLTGLPTHSVQMTVATSVSSASAQFSLASSKASYTLAELGELAHTLQGLIRASSALPAFSKATVRVVGKRLQVVSGIGSTDALIQFTDQLPSGQTDGLALRLGLNENRNVQRYSVGAGAAQGQQAGAVPGIDGDPPGATQLIGSEEAKTGLYALEDVNLVNLLCIPRTADLNETEGLAVISAATAYCTRRRAFFLVDPPSTRKQISNSTTGIKEWVTDKLTPERNAAVYWPNILVPDPLDNYRLRSLAPSGTLAGLYARTDSARGVWKAPAGTEATLVNVQGLAYNVTDAENGVLNPLGINCLRSLPVYGRIAWGARTTRGADQQADEYKYVPIRRLALFIEESLYRGTQWVVFEPNDEPLWSQIRLNLGTFMHNLFRQGAFQGKSPREAYFVKCDSETTTQADINRGIVNIVVGFAPLKPAEFVIIQLQQIAGQLEA